MAFLTQSFKKLVESARITKEDSEKEKRHKKRYVRQLKIDAKIYHRGDRVFQILQRLSRDKVLIDIKSKAEDIAYLYGSSNPSATIRDYPYTYASAMFRGKLIFTLDDKLLKLLDDGNLFKIVDYLNKNPKKFNARNMKE